MGKSHVSIGYNLCPICYKKHDEVVLLDKKLRKSLKKDTFIGFVLCKEHADMREEYVGIVEVSNSDQVTRLMPESAKPTGRHAMVSRESARQIFSIEIDTMAYIDIESFEKLITLVGRSIGE